MFNTEYEVNIRSEYAVNINLHHLQKLDEPITVLHPVRSSLINLLPRCT